MKNAIIGILGFSVTAAAVFAIYWLGGGDFDRGIMLATTSVIAIAYGLVSFWISIENFGD